MRKTAPIRSASRMTRWRSHLMMPGIAKPAAAGECKMYPARANERKIFVAFFLKSFAGY
jgi:hypothetical protein